MTPSDADPARGGRFLRRGLLVRSRHLTGLVVAAAAALLVTSACSVGPPGQRERPGDIRLVSFDSCESATERLRTAMLARAGTWSFLHGGRTAVGAADAVDAVGPAPAEAGASEPRAAIAPDGAAPPAADRAGNADRTLATDVGAHSGTNVHEAGADEPDLVKTDGRRIVTVADGVLRVVDVKRRTQTGALSLTDGREPNHGRAADLLLFGDRALVLWNGGGYEPMPLPVPDPAGAARGAVVPDDAPAPEAPPAVRPIVGPRLLLVDLAGAPRVLSEYTIDGGLVDARATGGVARVVVRSGPRLEVPSQPPEATERERRAALRDAVNSADVTDWLPRYQVTTGTGGDPTFGTVACDDVNHPADYSGTTMLTVLTFDLQAGSLGDGAPVSVVADGDTVYSDGTSLYVASDQRWRAVGMAGTGGERDIRTEIFKFDVSQPGPPRYVAAGAVDGWLINQYAMSQWDGHLRVATTVDSSWGGAAEASGSSSTVTVLAEQDGELVEVGAVGGLGRGERIYSVRYSGPVGYVVTFRETDPLYTLDLSDHTAPAVRGELKITGYSAYLHDLGDGRLLGVGQEADLNGVVQGTQVSLFDVSDLSDPQLRATHHLQAGHSEAESDPHAFLWWPAEQLLVIPVTAGHRTDIRDGEWTPPHTGALVLRVTADALVEEALLTHPADGHWPGGDRIRRSLVIGDSLWTVSSHGLQANDLASLDTLAWLPFR